MTAINFQTGQCTENPCSHRCDCHGERKPGVLLVGEQQEPSFQEVELGSSSGDRTAI